MNPAPYSSRRDAAFITTLWAIGGMYALLVVAMLAALATYTSPAEVLKSLAEAELRDSAARTIAACTLSTLLALLMATPLAYAMSRTRFFGRGALDALLDLPGAMPPLVVGLGLLILFQFWPFSLLKSEVVYEPPAIVIAQTLVATSLAYRALRASFTQGDARTEHVALTLGCSQRQAFLLVTLPEARPGLIAAGSLAWARCLGEFGPILVFASATPFKTEVLSTSIYLQLNRYDLQAAAAVALLLVTLAVVTLFVARRAYPEGFSSERRPPG